MINICLAVFFLLFGLGLGGAEAAAQTANRDPLRKETFLAICSECGATNQLKPLAVARRSSRTVPGGFQVEATLRFKCPQRKCREKFSQETEIFVPKDPRPKARALSPESRVRSPESGIVPPFPSPRPPPVSRLE